MLLYLNLLYTLAILLFLKVQAKQELRTLLEPTNTYCKQYSSDCVYCTRHQHCKYCLLKYAYSAQFVTHSTEENDQAIAGYCLDSRSTTWRQPIKTLIYNKGQETLISVICGLFIPDFINGLTCFDAAAGSTNPEYRENLQQLHQIFSLFPDNSQENITLAQSIQQSEDRLPQFFPEDFLAYFVILPTLLIFLLASCCGCCVLYKRCSCCIQFARSDIVERETQKKSNQMESQENKQFDSGGKINFARTTLQECPKRNMYGQSTPTTQSNKIREQQDIQPLYFQHPYNQFSSERTNSPYCFNKTMYIAPLENCIIFNCFPLYNPLIENNLKQESTTTPINECYNTHHVSNNCFSHKLILPIVSLSQPPSNLENDQPDNNRSDLKQISYLAQTSYLTQTLGLSPQNKLIQSKYIRFMDALYSPQQHPFASQDQINFFPQCNNSRNS